MIKETLLPDFDHEIAVTRKLLERIPDSKLEWRPHPKARTLGEIGTHIAALPNWAEPILTRTEFDTTAIEPAPAKRSRADIVEAFDGAARAARGWMNKTDPEYLVLWTLKRGGQQMFSLPRAAALRSFVISHLIHHRGQLSVYLRMNDVPLPPIYGPTADEG